MIRKVILCMMLALVFPAAGLKAKESSALQELTELSDTVFQLTRQSQYEEAVQILQYFEKRLKVCGERRDRGYDDRLGNPPGQSGLS